MTIRATSASRPEKRQFEHDLDRYAATASLSSAGQDKSWVAYGAAASVALLTSSGLEASIVYSGLQNIALPGAGTSYGSTVISMGGGGDFHFFGQAFTTANTTINSAFVSAPVTSSFGNGLIAKEGAI
jgi:hypothetical protein